MYDKRPCGWTNNASAGIVSALLIVCCMDKRQPETSIICIREVSNKLVDESCTFHFFLLLY